MCKLNEKKCQQTPGLEPGISVYHGYDKYSITTRAGKQLETDKFTTQCAHVNLCKYFSIVTYGVLSFLLGIVTVGSECVCFKSVIEQ